MSEQQFFRVWKLRSHDEVPDKVPAFSVCATSHEAAASQIALELSMGGYYRVHTVDGAPVAKIIRIVPVTTYEAVEVVSATDPASGVSDV